MLVFSRDCSYTLRQNTRSVTHPVFTLKDVHGLQQNIFNAALIRLIIIYFTSVMIKLVLSFALRVVELA